MKDSHSEDGVHWTLRLIHIDAHGQRNRRNQRQCCTCEVQVGTDEIIGNWLKAPSVVVKEWVVFIYS
jgi:hypothetical protein